MQIGNGFESKNLYYFPDVIRMLKYRKSKDNANGLTYSPAAGALDNLKLAQRASLRQLGGGKVNIVYAPSISAENMNKILVVASE